MQTYLKGERNLRRVVGISRRPGTCPQTRLENALLKIASVCFEAFRSRFGRDPFPDKPLFFDPSRDPLAAVRFADFFLDRGRGRFNSAFHASASR